MNVKKYLPHPLVIAALVATANFSSLYAAALKKAEITQIINQVSIVEPDRGERPASVKDVVQGRLGVHTGQKSRAELVFADETLTRLGANTIFNFEDGTRNLDLKQGVILLQVPKNSGGATIKTAAVTAAITGTTILFEHTPNEAVPEKFLTQEERRNRKPHGYIKVMVIEGTLKLWLKGNLGESILLGPGQMLVMADDATFIPESMDFDVEKVVKTSKLINDAVWLSRERLFASGLITAEIKNQKVRIANGELVDTNIIIQDSTNGQDFPEQDNNRDAMEPPAPEPIKEKPPEEKPPKKRIEDPQDGGGGQV